MNKTFVFNKKILKSIAEKISSNIVSEISMTTMLQCLIGSKYSFCVSDYASSVAVCEISGNFFVHHSEFDDWVAVEKKLGTFIL